MLLKISYPYTRMLFCAVRKNGAVHYRECFLYYPYLGDFFQLSGEDSDVPGDEFIFADAQLFALALFA